MKIGFDARLMSVPGGIGRYCRELLLHLTLQNPDDTYIVIVKKIPHDFPARENISWIESPIHWYTWAEQYTLGKLMNRRFDINLWHIPHWNVPVSLNVNFVMTIHDFIFEEFPTHDGSLFGKITFIFNWSVWRMLLIFNLKRAQKIITVSQYVRDEIVRRYPWAASKIEVTLLGVSTLCSDNKSPTPPSPYFLMVGNSYPHKNHALVFKTFAEHPELTAHLYVVTHRDRFSEEAARQTHGDARIHFVFDAPDTELGALYNGCTALIFPSLSEGFGIPPLEAFSFGKHVIAAKTSSLPEILGDLPFWIEPNDTTALYNAIMQALSHSALNDFEHTETRKKHAAKFTWEKTALSTQNIYKKIA